MATMNIFYLHEDVDVNAQYHVDKHVVKMILEYAQLLSTAHRILDGTEWSDRGKRGQKIRRWKLSNDSDERLMYKATHINHPSAVWCRANSENYMWLAHMLEALCIEYTYRYGKKHKVERDGLTERFLNKLPKNIATGDFFEPTPAMPDEYIVEGDSIQSYHNYYNGGKTRMFSWKLRNPPTFIEDAA
jgi:hypothetical protein